MKNAVNILSWMYVVCELNKAWGARGPLKRQQKKTIKRVLKDNIN